MAKQTSSQDTMTMPILNTHAAGIDVGSRFHVVAVGQDKSKDMATFGVTTQDLHQLSQFLQSAGVRTVALESTAYYWIPLFWMLQSYGFEVVVVNPADIKRIGSSKTDARDARWLQKLHALGLLNASFQLDNFSEGLRAYARRRRTLVADRNRIMNRIHKVLILMNVQIGTQLTDLDGATGTDIIRSI
jgi:transposase